MVKAILILAALLLAANLHAQTPNPGVTVSGTVRDPTGAVIPAMDLTLKSSDGITLTVTQTDELGAFHFPGVLPGRYLIFIEQPGFRVVSLPVEVGTRNLPPIVVKLQLQIVENQITVSSSNDASISDPASNRNSIKVDAKTLSNLPVLHGNYVETVSELLGQGTLGGGSPTIVVNGMETKNVSIAQGAIQEIRVNADPYSAEFWSPGSSRIEIITKPEGDQFHGGASFGFEDSVFDARNAFALTRPPEQQRDYDLFLSGPIRKDKDGFLVSFMRYDDQQQSSIFAITPSGDFRANVPTPFHYMGISSRLSHDVSASHHLSLEYNSYTYDVQNSGVGGESLPGTGADYSIRMDQVIFGDQWTLSPNKVNQLQARFEYDRTGQTSNSNDPKIIVEGAFTSGGAQTTQENTSSSFAINDTFSWVIGKHQLRFGANIPNISRNSLTDNSNFGGTYYFSNLAAYEANQPYLLTWQAGNPSIHFNYNEIAGFMQDQIQITPRLTGTVGLRYDWQSYFSAGKDFAPRASLAYALDKDSKTIVRLGSGIFYDRSGPSPISDILRYNGRTLLAYSLTCPDPNGCSNFPVAIPPAGGTPVPSNIVVLAPNARIPYSVQYSLGIEHPLSKQTTIAVTYRGARDFRLFRSLDINAPPPPNYLPPLPNPNFGIIRQIQSEGRQNEDGLDVSFRGSLTKYFTGQAQYTFSRIMNNTGGISYFPSNNYDFTGEWSRADYDRRNRFYLFGSTQAKDWFNLGIILFSMSGTPYNVTTGTDEFNDGMDNARPPGVPRNSRLGQGYFSLSTQLTHDFFLKNKKEKKGPVLNAGVQAFNLLNNVNYSTYIGVITSPLFGQPVSAYPARKLQMTLRFTF